MSISALVSSPPLGIHTDSYLPHYVKIVVEMFEQNVESACSVVVPASVKNQGIRGKKQNCKEPHDEWSMERTNKATDTRRSRSCVENEGTVDGSVDPAPAHRDVARATFLSSATPKQGTARPIFEPRVNEVTFLGFKRLSSQECLREYPPLCTPIAPLIVERKSCRTGKGKENHVENGFRSETFLGISGSVTTIIRSSLQHTTDRSINSRFSIIVVALRCRRGTAIARVINTERVDTRGSVKLKEEDLANAERHT
ncbi:hypothetical protein KCV00_g193, partial [Aureobasidium melanogenum]